MIDFIIQRNSDIELVIYDYSDILTTSKTIDNWELHISSNKLKTIVKLNLIDYIYTNRKEEELYIINPEILNLKDTFIDGLYKFEMYINNTLVKTHYVILYNNLYNRLKQLLVKYNYSFTISKVGYINYVDDCSLEKTEEIRILSNLIDKLRIYSFKSYSKENSIIIDDIIEKANRIAEILETE